MADTKTALALTPTLELHVPTKYARRYVLWGYAELLKFTSLVRTMIVEGKVRHRGERNLTEHVNRAVMKKTVQGAVLSSQASPGPIELARCLVVAVAYSSRPQSSTKPMLVVSQ